MTKLLIGLLGAGVVATGGYAAASSLDADPARTVSLPAATTAATSVEDVSGPCDEAEHRSDPRCTGAPASAPAPARTTGTDDDGEDVSGPCDEAEHRNDPRCTGGAAAVDDDDRSGHGSGRDDDDGDDDGEDRSGSNSGKG